MKNGMVRAADAADVSLTASPPCDVPKFDASPAHPSSEHADKHCAHRESTTAISSASADGKGIAEAPETVDGELGPVGPPATVASQSSGRVRRDTTLLTESELQDGLKEASTAFEKLQKKIAEKEEEKERMKKEKLERKRKEKIEKMKQTQVEKRICELDRDIKNSLGISGKNVEAALQAFCELDKLPLTHSLLLKEQDIIHTVKKCTKFTGDDRIKKKAEYLLNKFKNMLIVPTAEAETVFERHFKPSDMVNTTSYVDTKAGRVIEAKLRLTRLRPDAVPSILPNCPAYLSASAATTFREAPREKKARREAALLQEAVNLSFETHLEEERNNRIDTFQALLNCLPHIKVSKFWTVFTQHDCVLFLNLTFDGAPGVSKSVKITEDLSFTLFFQDVEVAKLDGIDIAKAMNNIRCLTRLLEAV
ncbi:hypothetical protein HPB51_022328 [Rhipicephalus microplus]|uniref:Lens epithelium-derived growth factor integrase-binding domain-containing protein n=1 Tax=Rhipicephalus microplus TaxID=6941 RepID=A0A9J6DQL8_RHIMP|nr:hypothetical protein HPB51_022328 [Rhipicephalus microplus]